MMNFEEILARVRQMPLFSALSELEARQVLEQCQIALYKKGSRIFREGSMGDSLMIVLQGRVDLTCEADDGVNVELATLQEGAVLGEMAVIDPAVRAATAMAGANTVLLTMQKEILDELLEAEHPAAAKLQRYILRLLAGRFRTIDDRIETLFIARLQDAPPAHPRSLWSLVPGE